jgi:hypothetical protein
VRGTVREYLPCEPLALKKQLRVAEQPQRNRVYLVTAVLPTPRPARTPILTTAIRACRYFSLRCSSRANTAADPAYAGVAGMRDLASELLATVQDAMARAGDDEPGD